MLADTVRDAEALGLRVKLLPTLTDVDEEKDLGTLSEEKGLAGKGAARP